MRPSSTFTLSHGTYDPFSRCVDLTFTNLRVADPVPAEEEPNRDLIDGNWADRPNSECRLVPGALGVAVGHCPGSRSAFVVQNPCAGTPRAALNLLDRF